MCKVCSRVGVVDDAIGNKVQTMGEVQLEAGGSTVEEVAEASDRKVEWGMIGCTHGRTRSSRTLFDSAAHPRTAST